MRRSFGKSACFDSRPRAGSDRRRTGRSKPRQAVSIHAPARGATPIARPPESLSQFRSTPPRGERHSYSIMGITELLFRSTPPRGERPDFAAPIAISDPFRSTPPRGERRQDMLRHGVPRAVSIHAPARGATLRRSTWAWRARCFDPRPRAGSDLSLAQFATGKLSFDPRPRAGSDNSLIICAAKNRSFDPRPRAVSDYSVILGRVAAKVSIHAPARGATGEGGGLPRLPSVSIHAPARGATRFGYCGGIVALFRATPPRGERLAAESYSSRLESFDPRPRAGSDCSMCCSVCTLGGFDPRPRAGSDFGAELVTRHVAVSIHAPARGATGVAGG